MEDRDVLLKQIRPEVQHDADEVNQAERFQNEVLRPILKLQNELILTQFKIYLQFQKLPFNALAQTAQKAAIQNSIKRDISLKNQLVPLVTSMLTLEEFHYFSKHRSEVVKRIVGMLIQRLQSQLQALY